MLRPAGSDDARGIARVHVASWRSTYAGLLPDPLLGLPAEDEITARFERRLRGDGLTLVVDRAGEGVIAYASGGREREEGSAAGELYAIYILREHQRRGHGGRLVRALAARLCEAGFPLMRLWVLDRNRPARAFYERLGGRAGGTRTFELEGEVVTEVAYAWDLPLEPS